MVVIPEVVSRLVRDRLNAGTLGFGELRTLLSLLGAKDDVQVAAMAELAGRRKVIELPFSVSSARVLAAVEALFGSEDAGGNGTSATERASALAKEAAEAKHEAAKYREQAEAHASALVDLRERVARTPCTSCGQAIDGAEKHLQGSDGRWRCSGCCDDAAPPTSDTERPPEAPWEDAGDEDPDPEGGP